MGSPSTLPLGFPLGVVWAAESGHASGLVARGDESVGLSQDEYQVWLSALQGDAGAELMERCRDAGVARAAALVDSLKLRRLLLELSGDAERDQAQLDELVLIPVGMAFGNTRTDPGTFVVGLAGQPAVQLPMPVFWAWGHSVRSTSLAAACEVASIDLDIDRAVVRQGVVESLPLLVSSGVAYLDLA